MNIDNTDLKSNNLEFGNDFDSYAEEIPVKNTNGSFSVVSLNTKQREMENGSTRKADRQQIADNRQQRGGDIKKLEGMENHKSEIINLKSYPALQPPVPAVIKNNKPVFMIFAEDEDEIRKLLRDGKPFSEENLDGSVRDKEEIKKLVLSEAEGLRNKEISGLEVGENLKTGENDKMATNKVTIDDLMKKREEVEKDVEKKVSKILEEIRKGLRHPEGAAEERLKDPVVYIPNSGVLRPPSARAQNDALGERLKNLLKTRIKGARNNIELWQALVKRVEEGGIGLSEKDADSVIKILSVELDKRIEGKEGGEDKEGKEKLNSKEQDLPVQTEIIKTLEQEDIRQQTAESGQQPQKEIWKLKEEERRGETVVLGGIEMEEGKEKLNSKKQDLPAQAGIIKSIKQGEERDKSLEEKKKDEAITEEREEIKNNFYSANRGFLGQSGKAKIEDIKYRPKLMGPVEEIRAFRINDFRNLADDPRRAVETLKLRIDGLEDESFLKKMEGITAWRDSEIYKTYLEIGRRAMTENKSIKKICDGLRESGENYLNEEEFYAVMDLNRKLRF